MHVANLPPDTFRGTVSTAGCIPKTILLGCIQDLGHPSVKVVDRCLRLVDASADSPIDIKDGNMTGNRICLHLDVCPPSRWPALRVPGYIH